MTQQPATNTASNARPPRRVVLTWLLLLALMAANAGAAYAPLGGLAPLAHVAIAVTMAGLVLIVFMELDRAAALFWVFAGAGFFWLAILFVMTGIDYWTRLSFAPT